MPDKIEILFLLRYKNQTEVVQLLRGGRREAPPTVGIPAYQNVLGDLLEERLRTRFYTRALEPEPEREHQSSRAAEGGGERTIRQLSHGVGESQPLVEVVSKEEESHPFQVLEECRERCRQEMEVLKINNQKKVQNEVEEHNVKVQTLIEELKKEKQIIRNDHDERVRKIVENVKKDFEHKENELNKKEITLKDELAKEQEEDMELLKQENLLKEARLKAKHKKEERAAKQAVENINEATTTINTAPANSTIPECPVRMLD